MVLYQPKDGYCYNSDTHFLFDFICQNLKTFKNIKGELLDIGSGSGILGLLLASKYAKLNLNQCELQEKFQFLSQKNSECNKIINQMYKGSFLTLKFDKKFDICVSNPPFYPSSVVKTENESLKIARYNDYLPLEEFINNVSKIISQNGKFFFCYDEKLIDEIIIYLKKYKFNIEALQFVHPKKDKASSLVLVYARKASKSHTKILPPLITFEDGKFTKEVEKIYEKSSTHSIKVEI